MRTKAFFVTVAIISVLLASSTLLNRHFKSANDPIELTDSTINAPGGLIVGLLALVIPGGFHNNGGGLQPLVPFASGLFYVIIAYWLIRPKLGSRTGGPQSQ